MVAVREVEDVRGGYVAEGEQQVAVQAFGEVTASHEDQVLLSAMVDRGPHWASRFVCHY